MGPLPTRSRSGRSIGLGLLMAVIAVGAVLIAPYLDAVRSGSRVVWGMALGATAATLILASPFVALWRRSSAPPAGEPARRRPSWLVWSVVAVITVGVIAYLAAIGDLSAAASPRAAANPARGGASWYHRGVLGGPVRWAWS